MAQKFRKVDPRIWIDEKFRQLAPLEQRVCIYCFTCEQVNRVGLYKFSIALAAEDLNTNIDQFNTLFNTVCHTLSWRYDQGNRVLYLPTWWKYNCPDNGKAFQGYLKDLHDVPETPLIKEFASNHRYLPDTLSNTLSDTLSNGYGIPGEREGDGKGAGYIAVPAAASSPSGDHGNGFSFEGLSLVESVDILIEQFNRFAKYKCTSDKDIRHVHKAVEDVINDPSLFCDLETIAMTIANYQEAIQKLGKYYQGEHYKLPMFIWKIKEGDPKKHNNFIPAYYNIDSYDKRKWDHLPGGKR